MKIIRTLSTALAFVALLTTAQVLAHERTISDIQAEFQSGKLTSVALVEEYYATIKKHNTDGADLRAVISLIDLDTLREQARQLDNELAAGHSRGELHGIPVLLKDNIDTADGLANTAGSYLLRDHMPPDDAFIVQRLRAAGAIIMGKANLSEWANFRSTNSALGWSSWGGLVKNPYDTSRTACGSSSGSAVAVSANFTVLAVGTETDGSLICPAAINGIVTIKPTVGLLSRDGIIPISASQDTAGPMARNVTDAVYMLDAMVGKDSADSASFAPTANYSCHLRVDGLAGKRIGVVRELMGYNQAMDAIFTERLEQLKEAGAVIVDDVKFPQGRNWGNDEFAVLLYEFNQGMTEYFAASPHTQYSSLQDLHDANIAHAETTMPWFGQELFTMALAATDKEAYLAAKKNAREKAGKLAIDAAMADYDLDLLIAPSVSPAWKIDLINGDNFSGSASGAAAVAGYPHITVPMGFVEHLPVGMSFFGTAKSEPILIEAAYAFEQISQARRAPVLR